LKVREIGCRRGYDRTSDSRRFTFPNMHRQGEETTELRGLNNGERSCWRKGEKSYVSEQLPRVDL